MTKRKKIIENMPIPTVPAGYAADLPLISQDYHNVFVAIDRRDGGLMICHKGEIVGPNSSEILVSPEYALALFRFFREGPIIELMVYHWRQQLGASGSPELRTILAFIDEHVPAITPPTVTETAPLNG